jgi:CheY-like chemotaxis protein
MVDYLTIRRIKFQNRLWSCRLFQPSPRFYQKTSKSCRFPKSSHHTVLCAAHLHHQINNITMIHTMQQKPDLLMIDDAPMMTRFLSLFFSEQYNVVTCNSSLEALALLNTGYTPAAMITDLDMPEMSGATLVETLRNTLPHCPIVVVSGLKESKYRLGALEAGADDYLNKPFHPAELQVRVTKLIRNTVKDKKTTMAADLKRQTAAIASRAVLSLS